MSNTIKEITGSDVRSPEQFLNDVATEGRPVVLRGLVKDWPAVQAAKHSPSALQNYLLKFDAGLQADAFFGQPSIGGKYYYNDNLSGFNFERRRMKLSEALEAIVSTLDTTDASSIYIGSLTLNEYLPGFSANNLLPLISETIVPRIWLGHRSNVSLHYDAFENIACVIAGRRRFTLFPPEAISHLYVGPIDNTMAGQPVSLAASSSDSQRFPLFELIKDQAMVVELEPGDALYLPKLWWHKVEALSKFNGLVNYWWDAFSGGPDAPYTSMLLSMITIAERPLPERLAWRAFFDHYVFRPEGHPLRHLPAEQHGLLGPLKETYGKLRARIMHLLRGG